MELQTFKNEEFGEIRTLEKDGTVWFVGKDVAEKLGYAKPRNAIATHVGNEDKKDAPIQGDLGGTQNMTIINESGLYALIFGSKLESAQRFKHWVTSEVLPSIRKHGAYMTGDTLEQALTSPDFLIRLATELKNEKERRQFLETEVIETQKVIEEMQPKVGYYDRILASKDLVTITQIAKDYGMSGAKFNELLKLHGIQYKVNGQWVMYSPYQGKGYVHSKTYHYTKKTGETGVNMQTEWTQAGRLFLYDFLKSKGLLPVIERD